MRGRVLPTCSGANGNHVNARVATLIRRLLCGHSDVFFVLRLVVQTVRLYNPTFVQASTGDRHPTPFDAVHVVGSAIDIDVDNQVRRLDRS